MIGPHDEDLGGKQIDQYAILRCLGKGGMGAVYLARDTTLDRPVAFKVLFPSYLHVEGIVQRFEREAKAAAKLNHPNIVQVYGVGLTGDIPYIAMECVDGLSLETLIKQEGPMHWQRALGIAAQIASALECAHGHGVVHRDIKPANVLVDRQGRVRVTDFGIAKVMQAQTQLTSEGTFIGTPQYMSPEQCGMGEVGPASDLFSLGVTLYELMSGRIPFAGNTPATLIRSITLDRPEPLDNYVTGVPQTVHDFIGGLLQKNPAMRYSTAREVLLDLARIRDGLSLTRGIADTGSSQMRTMPAHPRGSTTNWSWSLPSMWKRAGLLAVVVLCLLVAGALGARYRMRHSGSEEGRAAPVNNASTPPPSAESGPVLDAGATLPPPPLEGGPPPENSDDPFPNLDRFFLEHDANRDGVLTRDEAPRIRQYDPKQLDTNGDLAVSKEELIAAGKRMLEAGGPARGLREGRFPAIPELMKRYDTNGDGRLAVAEVPESLHIRIREADQNGDGAATLEELQASSARMLPRTPPKPR
ncbi:MAG: protein kinase [Candidatus Hydrogenedentes bacterium]|nr:protein kinase [Candidatus Hydrogenedentota bacterium]